MIVMLFAKFVLVLFLKKTLARLRSILIFSEFSEKIVKVHVHSRVFQVPTICQGDNHHSKNFVPSIKTRSPVVKAVKLMACRQAKSPVKITT